ncbi:hypothetical protein V8E55_011996 [Tylopilus felleus]
MGLSRRKLPRISMCSDYVGLNFILFLCRCRCLFSTCCSGPVSMAESCMGAGWQQWREWQSGRKTNGKRYQATPCRLSLWEMGIQPRELPLAYDLNGDGPLSCSTARAPHGTRFPIGAVRTQ